MLTFEQNITKLLNQYKLINKKYMSSPEWAKKMDTMKLRRKHLRQDKDNDVALYQKAEIVLKELSRRIATSNISCWYSGIDEFYQHFKSFLDEYRIEDGKVVHAAQRASRAMVQALQLIQEDNPEINHKTAMEIDQCGHVIAKYGSIEQQAMFAKTLKKLQHHDINFFLPLHQKFEEYLDKFTSFFCESKQEIA